MTLMQWAIEQQQNLAKFLGYTSMLEHQSDNYLVMEKNDWDAEYAYFVKYKTKRGND